jgi:hypothetical protein
MAVAAVATPLQWHAAEALLEVDMHRADMPGVDIRAMLAVGTLAMPAAGMLAIGVAWGRMVLE